MREFWNKCYENVTITRPWEKTSWVMECGKFIERQIIRFAPRICRTTLLDFGCGAGTYFPLYKRLGVSHVLGIDISSVVISYLKNQYKNEREMLIELVDGDIAACPQTGQYDIIMFWGVAHHLNPSDWGKYIECLAKLLSDDGVMLVSGWGIDDPRFKEGSPAYSVQSHKMTWAIDSIRELIEKYMTVEQFENLHYEDDIQSRCSDAYNCFVCRKKQSVASRHLSNLRLYLRGLFDRVSFAQVIRYSFAESVQKAHMDREISMSYYRDKGEMISLFSQLMHQVQDKCGQETSFTTEIYQRPQKSNIFVHMDALPQSLMMTWTVDGIGYFFKGIAEDRAAEKSHFHVSKYCISELPISSLFDEISKYPTSPYAGKEFSDIKKNDELSRGDSFAEKLFYAFNQGHLLHFYYFTNASFKASNKELGDGGLMLYAMSELTDSELETIDNLFKKWASALSFESFLNVSLKLATRTAIGSIMSRNGSHNIGSHVLAALSHNVGTMPDDRVLYQYIQHRMDYIANVTTDFPAWTQPTMFLGELMREFLSQRHLLEHIAESEGLSAWEFQNPNLAGAAAKSQHGKIKIRIRRKDQQGMLKDVIDYAEDGGGVELPQDVALAIPGGVVGNHAFYTILENVIRNAAKHGWSAKPITEKKNANLEITIDYTDKYTEKEGGLVEFEVWDNMSNADSRDKETRKSLLERQKGRMEQKLIEDDGRLRRENWGMAEIKISAGYLMSRGVNEIGGLSESGDTIVEPCQVKDGAVQRLGYKFSIRKPKDVIFVLGDKQKEFLTIIGGERLKALANHGIEFVEFTKVRYSKERNRFAARHVVMPQFGEEEKFRGNLPFRVLVWKGGDNKYTDLVAELDPSSIKEALQKPDADLAENLRIAVETAWLGLLRNQAGSFDENKGSCKRLEKGLALVVNTAGSTSNAGLGLITDDDLLEFVFKNGLRTAIETYLESRSAKVPEELCDILWVLHAIYPENWSFDKHPGVEIRAKIAWSLLSRLQMVENVLSSSQSIAALNASRSRLHLDECEGPLAERIVSALDRAEDYLKYRYGPPPRKGSPSGKEDRETVFKRRDYWTKNPHPIADFILHLRGVFKETDVFLRKYEERIATLPAGFSSSNFADGKPAFASSGLFGFVDILPRKPEKGCEQAVANYTRHDRPGVSLPEGVIYHEPLSGTQSYLNSLVRLSREGLEKMADADVILEKLTENALLKVCIADERMAKFLRDHQTVRDTYNAEKILVLDDKWIERCMDLDQDSEIVAEDSAETEKAEAKIYKKDFGVGLHTPRMDVLRSIRDYVRGLTNVPATSPDIAWVQDNITDYTSPQLPEGEKDYGFWEKGKEFDILVLHQGLIDKWLGESAHSEAHIAVFLELLKVYVKYIVITTGRGTPANIPSGARVLPFPTLESTLFKMYPEKMVLVDTIMNVLPVHGAEKKGENS